MEVFFNKKSKIFEITYYGLKLEFELFSIEYIEDKLKALKQDQIIFSAERLQIPNLKTFHSLTKDYIGVDGNEKYHFFAYIKFFIFDGQKFGLVGGKTNYPYPDISFDYKKGVARTFLNDNKLRWSDEIIIVNHEPSLDDRIKDNQQAIFLEKFLQRQFNLFDS